MSAEMVRVADASEIVEGELFSVVAGGRLALLTRLDGKLVAVANSCPHLGLPMTRGQLDGKVLRCPWHGSKFDLCSGENLDWVNAFMSVPLPRWTHKVIAMGKKPGPLETLGVEERADGVFVTPPTVGRLRS